MMVVFVFDSFRLDNGNIFFIFFKLIVLDIFVKREVSDDLDFVLFLGLLNFEIFLFVLFFLLNVMIFFILIFLLIRI